MEKSCRKCALKLDSNPLSILVNDSHWMQKILLKIRYFERGLSKTLKKLTLFFILNPAPLMNKITKDKRGLKLVASCSSGYKTSSEKTLYYWCITWQSLSFWVILKITSANLSKLINGIINYTKIWLFWERKTFLDTIKRIFHSFS